MGSKQVFFIKNSSKFYKDFELHLSKLLPTNPNSILVFLSSDTALLKKKKIINFLIIMVSLFLLKKFMKIKFHHGLLISLELMKSI